jgi:hypothetical protein
MQQHKLSSKPEYSEKFFDDEFEYRHVILPKDMTAEMSKKLEKDKKQALMSEE